MIRVVCVGVNVLEQNANATPRHHHPKQTQISHKHSQKTPSSHPETQIRNTLRPNKHDETTLLLARLPTPHWKHYGVGHRRQQQNLHTAAHQNAETTHQNHHKPTSTNTHHTTHERTPHPQHHQPIHPPSLHRNPPLHPHHRSKNQTRTQS